MSAASNRLNDIVVRLLRTWRSSWNSGTRPVPRRRLGLEALEDRLAPAALTVTSAADPATLTAGTLRFELNQANTDAAAGVSDTIDFDMAKMGGNTVTLSQGQLELMAGNGTTTIDGGGQIAISGNNASRVFQIDSGAQTVLDGLTIENGSSGTDSGGGIVNSGTLTLTNDTLTSDSTTGSGDGGGVANFGTLTVSHSSFSNCSASFGGGIYNGITTSGSLSSPCSMTVSDSVISSNNGRYADGGISNNGTLILTNDTVSGNSATYISGGIDNSSTVDSPVNPVIFGALSVTNCTIVDNSGVGISNIGHLSVNDSVISGNTGDGISVSDEIDGATLTLQDTIVAGNTAADIAGTITTDNGYNLLGAAANNSTTDPTPGPHDVFSDTPKLGPLTYYGGRTPTVALLPGSPAIGAGLAVAGISTDQRGFGRPSSNPDIGAFQTQAMPFVVTTAADPGEIAGQLSLREAVNLANAFDAAVTSPTITFASNLYGATVTLTQGQLELTAGSGTTTINADGLITVSGSNASRIFLVDSGAHVTLTRMILVAGTVTGDDGGGILNEGTLTINYTTVSGNNADDSVSGFQEIGGHGCGIANYGTLVVNNSTFSGNTALTSNGAPFKEGSSGGAIANFGTLSVSDSTFAANTARSTLDIGADRGAIFNTQTLTVSNSTFYENAASGVNDGFGDDGGSGGGICINGGTATVNDCTLNGNSAGYGGGGISVGSGSLTLEGTIIAGNTATSTGADVNGNITTDNGYNLLGTAVNNNTNDPNPGPHDIFSNAPLLAALSSNGGPTQTLALLPGSPAIGAGAAITGITFDERGVSRLNQPDIGAFQTYVSVAVWIGVTAPSTATAGTAFSITVNATDQYDFGYNGSLALSSSDGRQVNPSTVTLGSGLGYAMVTLRKAGAVTLSATAGSITGTSGSVTVSPAALYTFAVSPSVSQATAGSGFNVSIRARDRYGNTVTSFAGSVTLSCTGQSVYPGSVRLGNGAANPVVTLYSAASSVTLSASAGSITGTSSSFAVNADNGPSTDPTAEFTFQLFVTNSSGNSPQVMGPDFAPLADSTFTIIAQSDAQAQLDIANQESLLQQQDGLGIGSTITTVDPSTGIDSVLKAPGRPEQLCSRRLDGIQGSLGLYSRSGGQLRAILPGDRPGR